jgi:hypothetical protein
MYGPYNTAYSNLYGTYGQDANRYGTRGQEREDFLGGALGDIWAGINAGAYSPGHASYDAGRLPEFQKWWESLRGGQGTTALKDSAGNDLRAYTDIANLGLMSDAEKYAMRERPASQARSSTSALLEQMRNNSGWGSNPMAVLAAQKGLQDSLRSGNLAANEAIAKQLTEEKKWGYGQMEGAQGQVQGLEQEMVAGRNAANAANANRGAADLAMKMGFLNQYGDLMGNSMDWERMRQGALGGSGSAIGGGVDVTSKMVEQGKSKPFMDYFMSLGSMGSSMGGR